jgi:cysteine desulfuration protein SufE
MTLAEKNRAFVEELGFIEDKHERLTLIVERARRAAPLTTAEKIEANRVPGCVSPVWLVGEKHAERLRLRADAESPLVKGLVVLLIEFYDGAELADIAATEPTFLEKLGLLRDLSPTRRNGLAAVRARIRAISQEPS